MLLPLTEDRFEIDEFYGLAQYPQTTAIHADNMLTFNYLAKYWIMNGSTLIGSSSTILTEYYNDYKDIVVQNGSVVVIEGEIPDGAHVLFLTEDKTRADIVSRLITNKYAEQRLGISGMHTHDVVGERRRKICWDDLPRTTWKSEQDEPVFTEGEMLSSGKTNLIVGRDAAVKRALEIRIKSFDGELIHFGVDVEELGSLGEYMDHLTDDNLDNNSHVLIPNIYEIMREFYRSELIDNYSEGEYRSMLVEELERKEEEKRDEFERELVGIKGEKLRSDFTQSKLRVMRHWKKAQMRELEKRVSKFISDKANDIHEGYPQLSFVGAEEKLREFMELLTGIYMDKGIVTTFTLPVAGIKVTRKMRLFHKKLEGYQGVIDDLMLSMLDRCLFVFHDLGDLMVTDFNMIYVFM